MLIGQVVFLKAFIFGQYANWVILTDQLYGLIQWGSLDEMIDSLKVERFYFFFFLWLHLCHMEGPGLGVESELQLLAYTAATPDP